MANWANNQPNGSRQRRKWNLENKVSLNNLKSVIAEEGCPDVQFDLAKDLLHNTGEKDIQKSQQQAVRWLICASLQGQEDAASLLRKCYDESTGITAENEEDVLSCLSMSADERAARKAAHELFACLSNGNEHITPRQLERKMRKIYNLQRRRKHWCKNTATSSTEEDTESDVENENVDGMSIISNMSSKNEESRRADGITEANLVSAASNYAAGRLPSVSNALTLSAPHPRSLDHLPHFHRFLFHPVLFFTLLYHRLINFICNLPETLPIGIRFFLLLSIYWISNGDGTVNILQLFTYYLSFMVMLWSTCKILKTKKEYIDFRIWSGLFLQYGDHNIHADINENRFLRNNLRPYLLYSCAFVCNLIVYPLVSEEWLPYSELTILSGALVFCTLVSFMWSSPQKFPDWTVLVSFAVNVLAKYPYEMDQVVIKEWRFLDLRIPTFFPFVIGHGIEFCLNCGTAFYILIPVMLILLARRNNWHGSYTDLAPHCVTLCWLQICVNTSRSATMFGVIRAALALAGILLFLPLFGIISLFIPVFVAIDWIGFSDINIRWGSIIFTTVVLAIISCYMARRRNTRKYVTALQICIALIAASVLIYPHMMSHFKNGAKSEAEMSSENKIHSLDWQQYRKLCDMPIGYVANKISTQLLCANLNGVLVSWEGYVTDVRIARVTNVGEYLIANYFQYFLGDILRCFFGDYITERIVCDQKDEDICRDWQQSISVVQANTGPCTLQRWNRYEYEIKIRVGKLSSKVVLRASHEFRNFTRKLDKGDYVHFLGKLENTRWLDNHYKQDYLLGSASVLPIKLASIQCLSCSDTELTNFAIERFVKSPLAARLQDLKRGLKYFFNALLSPLVIIK